MEPISLTSSIRFLKGVGAKRADAFGALGVHTVGELLLHYPRAYEDRSRLKKIIELTNGETVCIRATVSSSMRVNRIRKNLTVLSLRVSDGTGFLDLVWFNNRYLEHIFHVGEEYIFYGRVQTSPKKQMHNPVFEKPESRLVTGSIFPVYPLTSGLTQSIVRVCVRDALKQVGNQILETLPESLRQKYRLCGRQLALQNIHFPSDASALQAARRRLVFEELFLFQTALFSLRSHRQSLTCEAFSDTSFAQVFVRSLPFQLTGAQERVLSEIISDLASQKPMNRLVQGDVGSGKTVIAAAAMYVAAQNGFQSAMMAPTEILAAQHFESLTNLLSPYHIPVALLTGSMNAAEKRDTLAKIADGRYPVVVGTHALISKNVTFSRLGLVITDEQHRFGVGQRKMLSDKGNNPHTLVMTATPIPRTLALVLYGDLDVSVIDELPPGRQKIDTFVVSDRLRQRVYQFIAREVGAGRQVYIVCPTVEAGEIPGLKAATDYAQELQKKVFPTLRIACLHGKMKPAEKEAVMSAFMQGKIQILVATSVIEVGVNVPNASIMVVENAERFGLAQLHQLRGRVGRGSLKSYCILFQSSGQETAGKRLSIMRQSSDGFFIAEKDLRLRGPGEFFGMRQHGLTAFRIADLYCDMDILQETTQAARSLLESDPSLARPEHREIRQEITRLFNSNVTFS